MIRGASGFWGDWTNQAFCPLGKGVIGFQLQQEKSQGGKDDTAANDLNLFCEDGSMLITKFPLSKQIEKPNLGNWSERKNCLEGQVICGLSVQIEKKQGSGDDTALNNVDFKCCQKQ